MIQLLKSHKILICAGTGGVGKTSLSAGLGVLASQSGLRTLVLTIDPARRLAQALGIAARPGEVSEVPGLANLSACMIDPQREFDQFVLGSVDKGIAKGLFNNRLYQQLVSNLSGSQEFTSLVLLLNAVHSEKYDLVILDTPPTQNAVEFLRAPERVYALFQSSVIGWFSNPKPDESIIRRGLHRGTRLVTAALERVTGGTFIQELRDFFDHVSHLQAKVAAVSAEVGRLLHSEKTGFLLVTGFDETKLKETLEFQQDLQNEGLYLRGVLVNRWFPEWTEGERPWPKAWADNPDFQTLEKFHAEFSGFFAGRQAAFERFVVQLGNEVPVCKLPDFRNAVQGIEDLKHVAETLRLKWNPRSPGSKAAAGRGKK